MVSVEEPVFDESLLKFSAYIGEIIQHPKSNHSGIVKIQSGDNPVYLSQSSIEHPYHTDSIYLSENEATEIVILHCLKPDQGGGGRNRLVMLRDIFEYWRSHKLLTMKSILQSGSVTFVRDKQSAVRKVLDINHGVAKIVYRADSGKGGKIIFENSILEKAYLALSNQIKYHIKPEEIALAENEILIIDNHQCLHSRTSYGLNSARLFNRIQVRHTNLVLGFNCNV